MIDYRFDATAATSSPNVIANIQSVPAFTSGQLSFQVTVNSALAAGIAKTTNAARIRFFDSVANQIADTNQATYNVVAVSGVDLTMTKSVTTPATGGFTVNNTGEYTLQVSNIGVQASSGVITVTDTLPGGLEVTGFNASGWTCSQTGSHTTGNVTGGGVSITCTSSAVLPAQASTVPGLATPIRVQVVPRLVSNNLGTVPFPAVTALPNRVTVTNTARVDGGNEPATNNGNNTGTIITAVGPVASIKGRVWQDINHNRLFNVATDSPLANWTVEVIDPATTTATGGTFVGGTVIKRSTTDASGLYAVADLLPGTYLIQFRDPANNVVNGRPVCDDTAAAAPGTAGTGSFVQANCNTPAYRDAADAMIGASPGATKSVLASTGRYLQVKLQGGETILNQSLPLDPSGIVYDANTGQPVTGAVVNMLPPRDQASGGLALVAGYDPATWWVGGAASFTTSGTGFYQFLLTAVGQAACTAAPGGSCIFSLQVTPPAGYLPWANALAAYPPTPTNGGGCPAAPVVAIPPAIGNHSCRPFHHRKSHLHRKFRRQYKTSRAIGGLCH